MSIPVTPMMTCPTCIVNHDLFARRGFTSLRRSWNRYHLFGALHARSPLARIVPMITARAAGENELLRVHSEAYVDLIQAMDIAGTGGLDGSTPAWHGMYARAERVVGGTLQGADLIARGEALHVFNAAGGQHHAHHDRGGGFCLFNDVVAGVRRLQDAGLRVAVLDFDGHHGDGTQSLLYHEPVLFISLHQYGERTYPGSGSPDEIGAGPGEGYTLNIPLARGTGDVYLTIVRETVEPLVRRYCPDVLLVQFGTDGHAADPLLRLRLSTAGYAALARWVHDLAHDLCAGRLLLVGGGGYDPPHVVRCWLFLLAELCGINAGRVHPDASAWLAEHLLNGDPAADKQSLLAAAEARRCIFPFHGLEAQSSKVQ